MAKTTYDDKRASLAQMLKTEPAPTPMQEVRPIVTKPASEEDVKISGFWAPAELAKQIKVHAAESGQSIREISIQAYRLYFEQLNK